MVQLEAHMISMTQEWSNPNGVKTPQTTQCLAAAAVNAQRSTHSP